MFHKFSLCQWFWTWKSNLFQLANKGIYKNHLFGSILDKLIDNSWSIASVWHSAWFFVLFLGAKRRSTLSKMSINFEIWTFPQKKCETQMWRSNLSSEDQRHKLDELLVFMVEWVKVGSICLVVFPGYSDFKETA